MPLLLCPNDNGSMQSVQRSGVEFDICPTCRGVWLDRGELENLLEAASDGTPGEPSAARQYQRPPTQLDRSAGRRIWNEDDNDDDDRRKTTRPSIFDIFD